MFLRRFNLIFRFEFVEKLKSFESILMRINE